MSAATDQLVRSLTALRKGPGATASRIGNDLIVALGAPDASQAVSYLQQRLLQMRASSGESTSRDIEALEYALGFRSSAVNLTARRADLLVDTGLKAAPNTLVAWEDRAIREVATALTDKSFFKLESLTTFVLGIVRRNRVVKYAVTSWDGHPSSRMRHWDTDNAADVASVPALLYRLDQAPPHPNVVIIEAWFEDCPPGRVRAVAATNIFNLLTFQGEVLELHPKTKRSSGDDRVVEYGAYVARPMPIWWYGLVWEPSSIDDDHETYNPNAPKGVLLDMSTEPDEESD